MFRVEWTSDALQDLAQAMGGADGGVREELLAAARALGEALRVDPLAHGEGREMDTERVVFASPLGAYLLIDEQERIVHIVGVWRFRRQGE